MRTDISSALYYGDQCDGLFIIYVHTCFCIVRMSGPKIDISEFTVLVKNSIEFPTVNGGERK